MDWTTPLILAIALPLGLLGGMGLIWLQRKVENMVGWIIGKMSRRKDKGVV